MSKKSNKREMFQVEGEGVKRKSKSCPRCGPGIFLAGHKGRLSCGKCGYTEFSNKVSELESAEKSI